MLNKLNEKDKRTIKYGAIGCVAFLVFWFGVKGYGNWTANREATSQINGELKVINPKNAKQRSIIKDVPIFNDPEEMSTQKPYFRDTLNEQLVELGISTKPWETTSNDASAIAGYEGLSLETSGTCRLTQLLDLLAALKKNPYLVGIDEFSFESDKDDPQRVEFSIIVSTIAKKATRTNR